MGIFDVFKTKVGEAAEKAGEVAGQAKDRVSDMREKKKGDAEGSSGQAQAQAPAPEAAYGTGAATTPEGAAQSAASNMVSEGAPVAQTGEAAPGAGDEPTTGEASSSGGMTQSIKDNVSQGADKAGEMAEGATGHRYDEKIDSGVRQAKDRLD